MKKAFIFCQHPIPTEHPNGIRFANLGLILKQLNYEVFLIGCDEKGERTFDYKGIHCIVCDAMAGAGLLNYRDREEKRFRFVSDFLKQNGMPDLILSGYYNCKAKRFLMHWCKKNRVPLIENIVEWYDRNNFQGFKGFLKFLSDRYFMYYQVPKAKNVIGISTVLTDYYHARGCNTVYIPTLVDMEEYQDLERQASVDVVKIAYAGSPAKKDYIANAIRAIELLSEEERKKISLHLYGASKEQIVALGIDRSFLEQNRECVVCHGRIPYDEVKGKITDADFTVLLRPNKRYANAGFPTKVGESMACSTPVIANLTSNLNRYILDGETGVVCRDETPEACAEALRRALDLSKEEKARMREASLNMAKGSFHYANYLDDVARFVSNTFLF